MVLEVQNLVKIFRSGFVRKKIKKINDVTFKVEAGEVFGPFFF